MTTSPTDALCSKCNANPRAGTSSWCQPCRTKYQKEYTAERKEMLKSRGFAQGVREMREVLAAEFERLATGQFSGMDCAILIRNAPGPQAD